MAAFADLCRFNPTLGGTTDFVYSSAVGGCQSPALANVQNSVKYKFYAVSADLTQWEVFEGAWNSGTTTAPRTTVLYNSSGTGTATGQSGAGTKINFSTVPQVAVIGIAEDLISVEVANSFTATQKEQARSNIGILATRYWSGFTHSNDIGTPNTKIDIAAGVCRDSTDALNLVVSSGIIDCTTVGANGLDAGALAASTWYYTFAITKANGTTAVLASLSPTAPTLPATYTLFRRIGAFKTDGSAHILAFTQVNDEWQWTVSIKDASGATINTTPSLFTLSVPRVQGVTAIFNTLYAHGTVASTGVALRPGFSPAVSNAQDGYSVLQTVAADGGAGALRVQVDSSGRISGVGDQAAGGTLNIWANGWRDPL